MRGRLEPKDTVERFWGLKFIGFPNLSDETPKPILFGLSCWIKTEGKKTPGFPGFALLASERRLREEGERGGREGGVSWA